MALPPLSWFLLVAAVATAAVCALVFLAQPGRLQNRLLALALFFGVVGMTGAAAAHAVVTGPGPVDLAVIHPIDGLIWVAASGEALAYMAFLGTVDSPWSRPLDSRRIRGGLAGIWVAALALRLVDPSLTIQYLPGTQSGAGGAAQPWFTIFTSAAIPLFGLLVAISYWRRTEPGTLRHRQAKAYTAAFGARDLLLVVQGVLFAPVLFLGHDPVIFLDSPLPFWFPPLGIVLFAPLIAYGILTTQLFDIDLKLKWTVEKSTVAAVFVAVFFVASEGAQVVFTGFAGSEIVGVVAAGLLVFFLAPLQRFADRVSDQAMPGVEDSPEYRAERKREIYRAQLEELGADEQITANERSALLRLQEDLGLDADVANRLEREVLEASGGEA